MPSEAIITNRPTPAPTGRPTPGPTVDLGRTHVTVVQEIQTTFLIKISSEVDGVASQDDMDALLCALEKMFADLIDDEFSVDGGKCVSGSAKASSVRDAECPEGENSGETCVSIVGTVDVELPMDDPDETKLILDELAVLGENEIERGVLQDDLEEHVGDSVPGIEVIGVGGR